MDNEDQLNTTAVVIKCKTCGYPTVQSEVDENGGNCPNCKEKFQPSSKSSS
jgi:rubrerythrin